MKGELNDHHEIHEHGRSFFFFHSHIFIWRLNTFKTRYIALNVQNDVSSIFLGRDLPYANYSNYPPSFLTGITCHSRNKTLTFFLFFYVRESRGFYGTIYPLYLHLLSILHCFRYLRSNRFVAIDRLTLRCSIYCSHNTRSAGRTGVVVEVQ